MNEIQVAIQLIINAMNEIDTDEIELEYEDENDKTLIFKCSLKYKEINENELLGE